MNALRATGRVVADVLAVVLAIAAIYTAGFGVFDNVIYYGSIVAIAMTIAILSWDAEEGNPLRFVFHAALAVLFIFISWVWIGFMLEQEEFLLDAEQWQLVLAWVAFAVVAYATWRIFGLPMLVVFALVAIYVLLPSRFFGAGEDWTRVAENLWYSSDGVFGRPVEVVGRTVLVFIVFGAVLQTSGAGGVLLKMAFAATGRFAGGAAHASIVGSALFGTMSGAAVANVVSTGVFTIPIIKKAGFKPKFAGGVEAAASTGGQIMPPVMGVVAFMMADVTGIAYVNIVLAALIPAVFYYVSLFTVVLIESRKLGIGAVPPSEREVMTPKDWLESTSFFLPLVLLVVLLAMGRTVQFAGFYALIAATVLSLVLFPKFRHPLEWWRALVSAGKTAATLLVIVAAVGFVIGVINMTGVGLKMAQLILSVSGSSLFFSLVLVMIGCLIMGMGVPSVPAYLIIAVVMGPALGKLGVTTISAHLFMVYFGVLSVVTPPVALAAFAAAPLAGAKPMATGFEALRISIAGFIIPFIFVYHTDILIIDGFTVTGLAWAIGAFLLATWLIASSMARFERLALPPWQSIARLVCAVALLVPDPVFSLAGAAGGLLLLFEHKIASSRDAPSKTTKQGENA